MSDKTDEWDFAHPSRAQHSDDSLIEAMARAFSGCLPYSNGGWDEQTPERQRMCLRGARAALTAQRTFKRERDAP